MPTNHHLHEPEPLNISFTPAGLAACHAFIAGHGGSPHNEEQLEAIAAESIRTLLDLLQDERWLLGYDTHQVKTIGATTPDQKYHTLTLHACQIDDGWMVGTPEEYPVSDEYLRRRRESASAIIRNLK